MPVASAVAPPVPTSQAPTQMPSSTTQSSTELRRLRTLEQLGAVGLVDDPTLQRIARLAAGISGASGAGVHIIDDAFQHRIASVGAPLDRWPRPDSMCDVVMKGGAGVSTGDATADGRFAHSSFVRSEAPVRFYAAEPLRTDDDQALGTLCVWDSAARKTVDDVDGVLFDLAAMVVDHLELRRQVRVYAEQAMTDSLTGLPNRRLFLDILQRSISRIARDDVGATLAMIDLDGFKRVNDDFGHDIGDEVLVTVGGRLLALTRSDELCARLGGDEFVMVVRGGQADARAAVARVVGAITEPVETSAGPMQVGASVGCTPLRPTDTPDLAMRRADVKMYLDKARATS